MISTHNGLDVIYQAVVLTVECRVDRGQTDVFVSSTITGDEVLVEQRCVMRGSPDRAIPGPLGPCSMSNVVKECMPRALNQVIRLSGIGKVHQFDG